MEKRRVTAAEYNRIKKEYENAEKALRAAMEDRKNQVENESGYDEKLAQTGSFLHDIYVLEDRVNRYKDALSKIEVESAEETNSDEKANLNEVACGDVVTIKHSNGAQRTVRLVSYLIDYRSEISTGSPAGDAIIGHKVGDVCEFVTEDGQKRSVTIVSIQKASEIESERE